MGTVLFLVSLAAGYAIAHDGFGASDGWSAASGWALAIGVFLFRRRRAYAAAARVDRYRKAAEVMRMYDRETYNDILAQAQGTDAEEAARADPDAYVALFLSFAEDRGYGAAAPT